MRRAMLSLLLLGLLFPLCVNAGSQTQTIKESALESTPINVGSLRIKLLDYRGSFFKIGGGSSQVEVENPSSEFAEFSPLKLSFVGKDNRQADVLGTPAGENLLPPVTRNIAPGARVKEFYCFTSKINLPARLYYDGKLIANIE